MRGKIQERRKSRRFDLTLPTKVLRIARTPAKTNAEMVNISAHGILLTFDSDINAGTSVEIEVDLPREGADRGPVRVRCWGNVIRVSRGHRTNVAIAIKRYEFLRGS